MKRNYTPLGIQPGDKFGRLTVIRKTELKNFGSSIWECDCDCGTKTYVPAGSLSNGCTKSCGCIKKELAKTRMKTNRDKCTFVDGTILEYLNKNLNKNNTSGAKGVSFDKQKGKWRAYIKFKGVSKHIGYFDTKEEAATARREAELKYFAPVLHEHGMQLKPQEIDQDMMKDDTYRRRPFYDFKKGEQ